MIELSSALRVQTTLAEQNAEALEQEKSLFAEKKAELNELASKFDSAAQETWKLKEELESMRQRQNADKRKEGKISYFSFSSLLTFSPAF